MTAAAPPRVVLVPGVPALLPAYESLTDPVAELRAAVLAAVAWLVEEAPAVVAVLADEQGRRVAEHLLAAAGFTGGVTSHLSADVPPVLVVANGSARRSEQAPGHLDERSFAFDEELERALRLPDPGALAGLDEGSARSCWPRDPRAAGAVGVPARG